VSEKPPLIERALLTVAPGLANRRLQARMQYEQNAKAFQVYRKYEAAKTGRRTDGWVRPGSSANAEVTSSFSGLSGGARQMVRDNGHAANAVNVLTNNTIGTGIVPGFQTDGDQAARQYQELWEEHVEESVSGAGEIGGVYERQAVAFRSIVESGSAILRMRGRRARDGLPLNYVVQVLEPDYFASHLDGMLAQGGGKVIAGKEYDRRDELVACHLYLEHPGDMFVIGVRNAGSTTRVLSRYFSHAYRADRPGQVHGASWFAPILTDLRDLADTRDAYQLRQKIAACYTAFIYESDPSTRSADRAVTDHIEPGRIESLPPGKEITFASPPGVDGMSDFDKAQLMTVAAGLGIPYEALTGDLRNVTFLSGRMGWLAFYRNIDAWRKNIVIPRLCQREMSWFLEGVAATRGIRQPVRVTWTAPHRDLLDPKQEIASLREEMRLGALSYPDFVRMRGRNPQQVLDEWERWANEVDNRDLAFDWDPRKFSMAGNNIEDQITEAVKEGNNA